MPEIPQEKHIPSSAFPYAGLGIFVLGALTGAAVGVFLAPDKGSETRRKVGGWMKDKALEGKKALLEREHKVMDAVSAGRRAIQEDVKKTIAAL